ncbi:hypothetical protein HYI12_02085 [Acinetobacter sp. SwsAc3]|nr:hypothetical protein [Acinetobacter sp. SwsAc3]
MDKIDFYFKVLARYDLYVQLANTKASNHITLLASILASVSALVGWGLAFDKPSFCMAIIVFLYIIFLYRCYEWYSSCMKVIEPNRKRNDGNTEHKSENELSSIFYSDVSKFRSFDSFKAEAVSRNDDDHLEDLIQQVSIMAKVTEKKYDDYEKVNGHVIHAVLLGCLILFFICIAKLNS